MPAWIIYSQVVVIQHHRTCGLRGDEAGRSGTQQKGEDNNERARSDQETFSSHFNLLLFNIYIYEDQPQFACLKIIAAGRSQSTIAIIGMAEIRKGVDKDEESGSQWHTGHYQTETKPR